MLTREGGLASPSTKYKIDEEGEEWGVGQKSALQNVTN